VCRVRFIAIGTVVGVCMLIAGGALHLLGFKSAAVVCMVVGGAALTPIGLMIAAVSAAAGLVVCMLPFMLAWAVVESIRARLLLRRLDRLDRLGGTDEEYDAVFRDVERHPPSGPEIARRVRDEDCPSRWRWVAHCWCQDALEEVTLRGSDPLAPFAWQRTMKIGWERECDLPDNQIVRLWARAVSSETPFAAVPELEATPAWQEVVG
jgi:hypothetical protein